MIYWNPTYEIEILADQIVFSNEVGKFSLRRPAGLLSWGVLACFQQGVSRQQVNRRSRIERDLVSILTKRKLLVHLPGETRVTDIDRNAGHLLTFTSDPMSALQRLRASTVCILGVGGIGTGVVQHLAGVGVRNFILVDHDRVEPRNLNRQFIFTLNDVGRRKVDAAKDYIISKVTGAQVLAQPAKINSIDSLDKLPIKDCSIIIHCLDTPPAVIERIVYQFGSDHGIPVVGAAAGLHYGHWGPLISPHHGKFSYEDWRSANLSKHSDAEIDSNDCPMPWSFGPTNTIIAANLSLDIIEWLSGRIDVISRDARLVQHFATCSATRYGSRACAAQE